MPVRRRNAGRRGVPILVGRISGRRPVLAILGNAPKGFLEPVDANEHPDALSIGIPLQLGSGGSGENLIAHRAGLEHPAGRFAVMA